MRTTLELPDPLFRSLKTRAAMDGTTLKDLVVRFVQWGLAQPEAATEVAPLRRGPFPVLIPTHLSDNPQPFPPELLTNAGLYQLLYAEEDEKAARFARGDLARGEPEAAP